MMMPHKYADLLRYAADNADACFMSKQFSLKYGKNIITQCSIEDVLEHEHLDDWQIYKEPATETVWYYKTNNYLFPYKDAPDLEQWFIKITYIDGKPTKAEFAE